MSVADRVNIFPSRANLVIMKLRMASAVKGLNMLKRKRDALEMKIREMRAEIERVESKVNVAMHEAFISSAKARYLCTDFKPAAVIAPERADVTLRTKYARVVGVLLPTFSLILRPPSSFPLTGLSHGGKQVEIVRKKYTEALKELIEQASLQYSEKTYRYALRQTNMRVNAIDYVVIPRYQRTINYIRDELEEYEREDFYRLKRSQAKQRKYKEKFREMVLQRFNERNSILPKEQEDNWTEAEAKNLTKKSSDLLIKVPSEKEEEKVEEVLMKKLSNELPVINEEPAVGEKINETSDIALDNLVLRDDEGEEKQQEEKQGEKQEEEKKEETEK